MNSSEISSGAVGEVTRVTCAGGGSAVFAAKVKGNYSYNIYRVRVVEILTAGQTPAEIGSEMKATNLAERFTQQGQLAVGKYVLVCTTGNKNIFYAEP
jgi:hypothetical protein